MALMENTLKRMEDLLLIGKIRLTSVGSSRKEPEYLGSAVLAHNDRDCYCIVERAKPSQKTFLKLTNNIKKVQRKEPGKILVILKDGKVLGVTTPALGHERRSFLSHIDGFTKNLCSIQENEEFSVKKHGKGLAPWLNTRKRPAKEETAVEEKMRLQSAEDENNPPPAKKPVLPPDIESETASSPKRMPSSPQEGSKAPRPVTAASPLAFYKDTIERYARPFSTSSLNMMGNGSSSSQAILPTSSPSISAPIRHQKFSHHLSPSAASLNRKRSSPTEKLASRSILSTRPSSSFGRPLENTRARIWNDDDTSDSGFTNLGNTCYMNAILQALLSLKTFTVDLGNKFLVDNIQANSLYKSMIRLLEDNRLEARKTVLDMDLISFKQSLEKSASKFSGYRQHDAHEFLFECLSRLHEDAKAALSSETQSVSESVCPVSLNFESRVNSSTTCKECKRRVQREETYYSFSLDIPLDGLVTCPSVQWMLDKYFEDEEVDYACSACGCKKSVRSQGFVKLPRILILLVKRYKVSDSVKGGIQLRKRSDVISIPRQIGVDSICSDEVEGPCKFTVPIESFHRKLKKKKEEVPLEDMTEEEQVQLAMALSLSGSSPFETDSAYGESPPKEAKTERGPSKKVRHDSAIGEEEADCTGAAAEGEDQDRAYDLVGVVSHLGAASSNGHYVCDVYDVENDSWKSCNDSIVTETKEATVRKDRSSAGYLFFYAQKQLLSTLQMKFLVESVGEERRIHST